MFLGTEYSIGAVRDRGRDLLLDDLQQAVVQGQPQNAQIRRTSHPCNDSEISQNGSVSGDGIKTLMSVC